MEFLIAFLILASFIGQAVLMKTFIKKAVEKLSSTSNIQEKEIFDPLSTKKSQKLPLSNKNLQSPLDPQVDRPEKNHVLEANLDEEEYVDGMALPRDVKVEVEGGDMNVPPGYEEKEAKK